MPTSKVVLLILDGWGLRPDPSFNAIIEAKTPVIDTLSKVAGLMSLQASGESVGLPWGEMGNSEVGHINIGSGRVVLSDYTQISQAIKNRSFYANPVLNEAVKNTKAKKSNFHIIGLATNSGVHGSIEHMEAIIQFAVKSGLSPLVHLITDGRDTPPKVAHKYVKNIEDLLAKFGKGKIATVSGRYYAMDRDKRWERTAAVYEALVSGHGEHAQSAEEAIKIAYDSGKTDEFILPTIIGEMASISDNDSIIFTNFRADRAIQLTKYFLDPNFTVYKRKLLKNLYFATMTQYEHGLHAKAFYTVVDLNNSKENPLANSLAQVISEAGLKQLHAAESEKFAHVTYFFNAGQDKPFKGEDRVIVPSPKVATYDLEPKMSASQLASHFINHWQKQQPEFSVVNFANADMVGHTGDYVATQKAIEAIDEHIGNIVRVVSKEDIILIITADHGNAEEMQNPQSHTIDKEHSTSPVPFIAITSSQINTIEKFEELNQHEKIQISATQPIGLLADIAPTILRILELKQPKEMTGASIWTKHD